MQDGHRHEDRVGDLGYGTGGRELRCICTGWILGLIKLWHVFEVHVCSCMCIRLRDIFDVL